MKRESIHMDVRAGRGVCFLLWGEPGLRWVWGWGWASFPGTLRSRGLTPWPLHSALELSELQAAEKFRCEFCETPDRQDPVCGFPATETSACR